MPGGRPKGVKNKPNHNAGGRRKGAGRKPKATAHSSSSDTAEEDPATSESSNAPAATQPASVSVRRTLSAIPGVPGQTAPIFGSNSAASISCAEPPTVSSPASGTPAGDVAQPSGLDPLPPLPDAAVPHDDDQEGADAAAALEQDSDDDAQAVFTADLAEIQNDIQLDKPRGWPMCYRQGSFWHRRSPSTYLATRNAHLLSRSLTTGSLLRDPNLLIRPDLFVWIPDILCDIELKCKCGSKLNRAGWNNTHAARLVRSVDRLYGLLTCRYECSNSSPMGCPFGRIDVNGNKAHSRTYQGHDDQIIKQLPAALRAEFPAFLSWRAGIDETALRLVRALSAHRVGPGPTAAIFNELYAHRVDSTYSQWLSEVMDSSQRLADRSILTEFRPSSAARGEQISGAWLSAVFLRLANSQRQDLDAAVSCLGARVLKVDESFKLPKKVFHIGDDRLFGALVTGLNEHGEIVLQKLSFNKGHSAMRRPIKELVERIRLRNLPQIELAYVDNPHSDAGLLQTEIPSLNKGVVEREINPHHEFQDLALPHEWEVSEVCQSANTIEQELQRIVTARTALRPDGHLLVGFDTESPASRMQWGIRSEGPTALVQLAFCNRISLLQISALPSRNIPDALRAILSDPLIYKVGQGAPADLTKLSHKYGVPIAGGIDVGTLCKRRGILDPHPGESQPRPSDLSSLVAITLGRYLPKPSDVRISAEWSEQLSPRHVNYAALDAWAGLAIYEAIAHLPSFGEPLRRPLVEGTSVTWSIGGEAVAHGDVVPDPEQGGIWTGRIRGVPSYWVSISTSRAMVKVTEVIQPDAWVNTHGPRGYPDRRLCLEDFGAPPFNIIVPLNQRKTRRPAAIVFTPMDIDLPPNSQSDLPAASSGTQATAGPIIPSDPSSEKPRPTRVFRDVFHMLKQLQPPKSHSVAAEFSRRHRDAVFSVIEEDKVKVLPLLAQRSLMWDEALVSPAAADWLWARVRRTVADADTLYTRLKALYSDFEDCRCSESGQLLFSDRLRLEAKNVLDQVQKGWLSDPPDVNLYVQKSWDRSLSKTDKSKWIPIWRCLRGTNSVEGLHQEIIETLGTVNGGPELVDARLAELRHRWNLKVGTLSRLGRAFKGHYNLALLNEIQDLEMGLFNRSTACPDWLSYSAFRPPPHNYGIQDISNEDCSAFGLVRCDHDDSFDSEDHSSCHAGLRLATRPFLAARYHVRFAITPFETRTEFSHFRSRMRELHIDEKGRVNGGRKLDILAETRHWNLVIANGVNTFYKVPYYFESQLKAWLHQFHEKASLIGFQPSSTTRSAPTGLLPGLHSVLPTRLPVQQCIAPTPPLPQQARPSHPAAAPLSLAPPPLPQTDVRIRSSTSQHVVRGAKPTSVPRPEKLRSRRECQVCYYRAPPEPARNCKGTGKRSSCEKLGWYNGDFFSKWGTWPEGCNISLAARVAIEAGVQRKGG